MLLGVIDIAVIAGLSILIGASAPHWPESWLQQDSWVTKPRAYESPAFFRRIGVARWAARLPELGSLFGGKSKREIPGRDLISLEAYLVEVRRAIWVHTLSLLTWISLIFFNPWWMTLAGLLIATVINLPFLLILRGNNARVSRMVRALNQKEQDRP